MSGKKGPSKTKKPAAKTRTKTIERVIDIDMANRDNITRSVQMNTKITDKEAKLIASLIIEFKQLLVKNWKDIRDIRDEFFGGKIKFTAPCVVDCSETPEVVKVKLAVPRPPHKDAAETTTEDPEQLTMETVSSTIPVRTSEGGVVKTPGDGEDASKN